MGKLSEGLRATALATAAVAGASFGTSCASIKQIGDAPSGIELNQKVAAFDVNSDSGPGLTEGWTWLDSRSSSHGGIEVLDQCSLVFPLNTRGDYAFELVTERGTESWTISWGEREQHSYSGPISRGEICAETVDIETDFIKLRFSYSAPERSGMDSTSQEYSREGIAPKINERLGDLSPLQD